MFAWMELIAQQKNIRILHKMNNGFEKWVGPYLVDGYDPDNNTIYEIRKVTVRFNQHKVT